MDQAGVLEHQDGILAEGVDRSLLLRDLSGQDRTAVLRTGRLLQRSRGQPLLRRGVDAAVVILDGAAKEHRTTSVDDEVVMGLLGPGDVGGLAITLAASSDADLTALDAAQALLLSGRDLRALARERPAVALGWLQVTSERLCALRHEVVAFASTSTAERIAYRLVELADRFGEPSGGEMHIPVRLTQEELASWAGASRESAAKALHDLRRAGIVVTRRRSLTLLDVAALRRRLPSGSAPAAPEAPTIDLTVTGVDETIRRG